MSNQSLISVDELAKNIVEEMRIVAKKFPTSPKIGEGGLPIFLRYYWTKLFLDGDASPLVVGQLIRKVHLELCNYIAKKKSESDTDERIMSYSQRMSQATDEQYVKALEKSKEELVILVRQCEAWEN